MYGKCDNTLFGLFGYSWSVLGQSISFISLQLYSVQAVQAAPNSYFLKIN